MNPLLDKTTLREAHGQTQRTSYTDRVDALLDSLGLSDAWREQNPTRRRYTFRRGKYASRLDYFLLSDSLVNTQLTIDIIATPLSDHSILAIKLCAQKTDKGPGLWRFNNLLLAQEKFITLMRATIEEIKAATEPSDPKIKWEWLKFKIREFARGFERNEFRQERHHETQLKKRLEELAEKLDSLQDSGQVPESRDGYSAPSEADLLCEREGISREIKELELSRANRTILRSNANWALNGERPSKIFESPKN